MILSFWFQLSILRMVIHVWATNVSVTKRPGQTHQGHPHPSHQCMFTKESLCSMIILNYLCFFSSLERFLQQKTLFRYRLHQIHLYVSLKMIE